MTRTCTARFARQRVASLMKSVTRRGMIFRRDEDGAMIVFGIMIFGLMLAVGGLSFDIMRYEANRERLQSTLDRSVLAAASLTQSADPKGVVIDYFEAAGMGQYISADDIVVTQAVNFRRVDASAKIHVPLHHGDFAAFGKNEDGDTVLIARAHSVAEESIGDVEISLVLDISGSMGSYNRLTNLKSAANDFLDTVYGAAQENSVSTSIIPYSTQVNAGETLISQFTKVPLLHDESHCLHFQGSDFNSAAMSLSSSSYTHLLHFDPWTDEHWTNGYAVGENKPYNDGYRDLPAPVCRDNGDGQGNAEIMAWSTDLSALKTYVNGLSADGNTSTDIGAKWGAALLDPSMQDALSNMIVSGDVNANIDGRPAGYNDGETLKIMIVMTDGVHTSQYYMDDYRTGDSFVWKYVAGDNVYYSIWYDGEGSTPDMEPVCKRWKKNGTCKKYKNSWFVAYNTNFDGDGSTQYMWKKSPYDGDSDEWDLGAGATRMTWTEVWSEIPPEYFSDEILWEMDELPSSERNAFENAISSIGSSTKNTRLDNICNAATDNNVIVWTIGLEVPNSYDQRLKDCATSPSHYYEVNNLSINNAFSSIAAQINQLRLTQ